MDINKLDKKSQIIKIDSRNFKDLLNITYKDIEIFTCPFSEEIILLLNIEKLEKLLKIKNLILATQFIIFNKSIFLKILKINFLGGLD